MNIEIIVPYFSKSVLAGAGWGTRNEELGSWGEIGRCVTAPLPKGAWPDHFDTLAGCVAVCGSVEDAERWAVGLVDACRDRLSLVMTRPLAVWEEGVRRCLLLLERARPDLLLPGAGTPPPQLSCTLTKMKPMCQSSFGAPMPLSLHVGCRPCSQLVLGSGGAPWHR